MNPHYWLDPVLAQKQVEAIASALVAVDPDNKDFYLENAAGYVGELKSLDAGDQERDAVILLPRVRYLPSGLDLFRQEIRAGGGGGD